MAQSTGTESAVRNREQQTANRERRQAAQKADRIVVYRDRRRV